MMKKQRTGSEKADKDIVKIVKEECLRQFEFKRWIRNVN